MGSPEGNYNRFVRFAQTSPGHIATLCDILYHSCWINHLHLCYDNIKIGDILSNVKYLHRLLCDSFHLVFHGGNEGTIL